MNPSSNLGRMLRSYRLLTEQSMREVARRIGISSSTVCRLEQGYPPDAASLLKLLSWMLSKEPARAPGKEID